VAIEAIVTIARWSFALDDHRLADESLPIRLPRPQNSCRFAVMSDSKSPVRRACSAVLAQNVRNCGRIGHPLPRDLAERGLEPYFRVRWRRFRRLGGRH